MIIHPEYFLAFTIGFFGSLHCIGMCGPIALSIPSLSNSLTGRVFGGLTYNVGRILTYALFGLIAGFIGKSMAFFKWQQGVSVFLGALIILYIIVPQLLKPLNLISTSYRINNWVKSTMGKFLQQKSVVALLSIGLANGLLPCGLVYLAIAGSMDSAGPLQGASYMVFFGFGTLPMMIGVNLLGHNLKGSFKNRLSRLIPVFAFFVGVLFILRGLGLGIPYVSPSMDPHAGDVNCHLPEHRH